MLLWLQPPVVVSWRVPTVVGTPVGVVTRQQKRYLVPVNRIVNSLYRHSICVELPSGSVHMVCKVIKTNSDTEAATAEIGVFPFMVLRRRRGDLSGSFSLHST